MRTTEEWFNELKDDYREKALKNMKSPKTEHYSLAGAISNGFVWTETPEGKDYWNSVFREIMYGEPFISPKNKVIESGLIEVHTSISGIEDIEVDIQDVKPTIFISESSDEELELEEKGGNMPDLLNQYKAQQDNTK